MTTIENLQREDLDELEEAQGFKAYIDKKGEDAIDGLAERCGLNPRYVRRRVWILKLPEPVLHYWRDGELSFGHLEQLMRLPDEDSILDMARKAVSWGMSVARTAERIKEQSPPLKWAKFSLEEEGCLTCANNSGVQRKLFAEDTGKKDRCLNPKCFRAKQRRNLTETFAGGINSGQTALRSTTRRAGRTTSGSAMPRAKSAAGAKASKPC